jgi:hypothetical protein
MAPALRPPDASLIASSSEPAAAGSSAKAVAEKTGATSASR